MNRNKKEQALEKFVDMIQKSWTYARLTELEKENLMKVFYHPITNKALKGTFLQRWEILQAIYDAFLGALDYKPIGWREKEEPLF